MPSDEERKAYLYLNALPVEEALVVNKDRARTGMGVVEAVELHKAGHPLVCFYFAAGYSLRDDQRKLAEKIAEISCWKLKARWLAVERFAESPAECALEDFYDLFHSDALVIRHGPSTRGGKWVEMGMAIAWDKPIIFWNPENEMKVTPPVFAWLDGVKWIQGPPGAVAEQLVKIREDIAKAREVERKLRNA